MVIPNASADAMALKREQEQRKKETLMKQRKMDNERDNRTGTPEPKDKHQNIPIQTSPEKVELVDKPPDREVDAQTDFYIDRPPTPRFIPTKTGQDRETQIEDGELFDFDVEVEPILQVIVGKTLEQSRMEVLEEEELEAMRSHAREFERLRDAQLIETQRMESEEKRRADEIDRRKLEAKIVFEQKKIAHQK